MQNCTQTLFSKVTFINNQTRMRILSVALSFCLLQLISCNNSSSKSSKAETLYIQTTTATKAGEEMKVEKTMSEISTDYFEVSLASQTNGGFLAQKDIVEPEVGIPFKSVFFTISQKDGTNIKFMTSTEFLNFMSAHGYELENQIPNQYGGDYTFKRK